jgi:hypothetical protein
MKKGFTWFGVIVILFGALLYYGGGSSSKLNLSFLDWANQTYGVVVIVVGVLLFLYGLFGRNKQISVR